MRLNCRVVSMLGALLVLLSGCVSMKSVVDPTYGTTKYEDLAKRQEPLKLKVNAEFWRSGEHFPNGDSLIKDNVERVLRASGIVEPGQDASIGEITIIVNNFGDKGDAMAKGFGTGLTFGLVGSTVTDFYEMTVTVSVSGKSFTQKVKHAIHTTIGNASTPAGLEVLPIQTAFERVLEQMLLNSLKEFQKTGVLASNDESILGKLWAMIHGQGISMLRGKRGTLQEV